MTPLRFPLLALAGAALLLSGCAWMRKAPPREPEMHVLIEWMVGDFDNTESLQDAARARREQHFPVTVHARRVPGIENALYIEQASMTRPHAPYRQRVYKLRRDPGPRIVIEVWQLVDPDRFVNAHLDPSVLGLLTEADLVYRDGCDVVLRWDGEAFAGGTTSRRCESAVQGAVYMTSRVSIRADGFSSMDRGWDDRNRQVWGPEKLAYEFRRTVR